MSNERSGYNAGSFILSFIIGGLVGAGIALLFAPESGEKARKRIKELAGDVKEKAAEYTEQVKSQVTSTVEKGKGLIEEKKSLVSAAIEAGKEAYGKEKEKLAKES
jgi:gas vesicle protein